jgi:signal transduction histidine kinase
LPTPDESREWPPRARRGGPPPWVREQWSRGPGRGRGRRRFLRRVGLFLGLLVALLFAASLLAAAVFTAALGGASAGTRVGAALVGVLLFVAGLVLVGRSVRRMFGPIGEVMEAADRVAGGDYSTRVSARGPGEVRRLGHAFNEMTTRLQASDDQRRRLLADVTHELRTPVAVVQGNLEAMVDGVHALDEEHLLTVLEETRVMARLLDDLQTLSTADAGALRLDLEPTDLAAVADEVVSAFAPTAALAGVTLTSVGGELPEVDADPFRIRQVLDNLVANAVRHTPAGGAVTIRLTREEHAIVVAVEDSGRGIPEDQLDTVFDRYSRSADSGGSGLGLAIAKSLVEVHGGSIEAANAGEQGAVIRFRLPLSG